MIHGPDADGAQAGPRGVIEAQLRPGPSVRRRTEAGGGYHKIRLTTKQKGLIVQTREGYYGS